MSRRSPARVLVVGAGPAGCACAFRLGALGHDVWLAGQPAPQMRTGETCSGRVMRALRDAGMPEPNESLGHPLAAFLSAWGAAELDGRSVAFWQAEHALVVHRPAFERWLRGAAQGNDKGNDKGKGKGARLIAGDILGGAFDGRQWTVRMRDEDSERELCVDFVVEATGRNSSSAFQRDLRRSFTDRLICLYASLADLRSGPASAVIEACEVGWWFSVPTPDGQRITALFSDADLIASRGSRAQAFHALLGQTEHTRASVRGDVDALVRTSDARTGARNILWRGAWLTIGDAAWCVDPLSGNGIQRAVEDGLRAASAIASYFEIQDTAPLRAHATQRGNAFREALRTQAQYYAMEQRWPASPFWQRRHAVSGTTAVS